MGLNRTAVLLCSAALLAAVSAYPSMSDYRTAANRARVIAADLVVPDSLQRRWDIEGMSLVKSDLLRRYPRLEGMSDSALVVALREIAYRHVKVGVGGGNLSQAWRAYHEAIVAQSAEHSCQGINIIYRIMLTAFGVPSREVDFYGDNEVSPQAILYSHATTDVLVNGTWEASDATFNMSVLDDNGRKISWVEAFGRVRDGSEMTFSHDGLDHIASRTIEDARPAIIASMNYMVVIGGTVKVEPSTWNGEINLNGRLRLDLLSGSHPIYYQLPRIIPH